MKGVVYNERTREFRFFRVPPQDAPLQIRDPEDEIMYDVAGHPLTHYVDFSGNRPILRKKLE